jgi:hypothetical protein
LLLRLATLGAVGEDEEEGMIRHDDLRGVDDLPFHPHVLGPGMVCCSRQRFTLPWASSFAFRMK